MDRPIITISLWHVGTTTGISSSCRSCKTKPTYPPLPNTLVQSPRFSSAVSRELQFFVLFASFSSFWAQLLVELVQLTVYNSNNSFSNKTDIYFFITVFILKLFARLNILIKYTSYHFTC